MKRVNLICLLGTLLYISTGCSKSSCEVADWVGVYAYDSDCGDGGSNVIEVDENGNPIEAPVIEDVTLVAGETAGTISFDFLELPIDGCQIDLSDFGLYTLDGDQLTVDFGDGDCKIFIRK